MSLQLLAKQMEAKGRDGDSVLVHMTHGEVAGLQKLAESAGGSLSVNPDTGLVEANFLKSILPTVVGLGVGMATGNPYLGSMAGAAVGGIQAKRDDQDVGMGIIAGGFGGYGGATMGTGLMAAGAPASAGPAVIPGAGASITAPASATSITSAPASFANIGGTTQAATAPMTMGQKFSQSVQGFQNLGTEAGREAALKSMGGSEAALRAMMYAGMPYMNQAQTEDTTPGPYKLLSTDLNQRGGGSPSISAYEAPQRGYTYKGGNVYVPTFTAAKGGEVGFFTGGGTGLLSSLIANRPYIIDPATGNVIPNPNFRRPERKPFADVGIASGMGGNGGSDYVDPNPGWTAMSPEAKAAYYADRPNEANIVGIAQNLFGMTPLGIAQSAIAPEVVAANQAMVSQAPAPVSDRFGMDSGPSAGMGGAYEGSAGSTAATTESPDGPDGANASAASTNSDGSTGPGDSDGRSSGGGDGVDGRASGGLLGLAKGGMASGGFVIPADVVSMVGEGNTDAGYKRIKSMVPGATAIKGKDGGQADTVKTKIDGKQPARVAHGEMYVPPETVKRMGGAKKLYAMMDRVREQATGSKKQIKPVNLRRAMA